MLVIDIKEPVNIAGTWEELIAREMVALSVLGHYTVNADQTSVTWTQASPGNYVLSANGSDLTATGIELTGGHVDGFHFLDRIPGTDAVAVRHFNRDATVLQAKIDQSYQLFQDGASLPEAFAPLVNDLFRHRPIKVIGSNGDDIIEGGNKNDIINGKTGNDFFHASRGDDTIHGGPGSDAVDYSGLGKLGGVNGGFDIGHVSIGGFKQSISGIEGVTLTYKDDILSGDAKDNYLFGGGGHDDLSGKGGDDTIKGENGSDNLYGGPGNDLISGGDGNDVIYGGSGNDDLYGDGGKDTISGKSGRDFIFGGHGRDRLKGGDGVDKIDGGGGNDNIEGNKGVDVIDGAAGADIILGGPGNDRLRGGSGADTIHGGQGNDLIKGQNGYALLSGGGGDDTIDGGGNKDELDGGPGNDSLFGAGGDDNFYYSHNEDSGNDTITGMSAGDRIFLYDQAVAGVAVSMGIGGADIAFDSGTIHLDEVDAATVRVMVSPFDNDGPSDAIVDIPLT